MKNIEKLRAFVHTLQMKSPEGLSEEVIKDKHYLKKGKISCTERGFLYRINPNNLIGNIYSYNDLKLIMEAIRIELGMEEWEFDRIDLAVDSVRNYDEVFKINKYVMSLMSLVQKTGNFMDTCGGICLEKRSLKIPKRKFTAEIYNKKLESKGAHPYTRCEFRFKLLDKERQENIFNELYGILDSLVQHIDKLNTTKVQALYKIWCKEKGERKVKSINEFYRKYSDEIFTVEISKRLFSKITDDKYDYKTWIGNLRRSYKVKFISKRQLNAYINEIKRAVKEYETTPEVTF